MKRLLLGLCLFATPAFAQEAADIKPAFTASEAQAAIALWDAGLKAIGGNAAESYVVLARKMQAAAQAAQQPQPKPAEPPK